MSNNKLTQSFAICALLALAWAALGADAGQGCPFDDGSCQEYCSQQGCSMGYCGHFAWIQCICRKCGDEWSWYDKVRYNPDKTVNQTELDSLKLNATTPLILTNSSSSSNSNVQQANVTKQAEPNKRPAATLTTLLIPDLSEGGKLDLNDIPDENSDKFLDYLAKNHEKLVQATSARGAQQQQQQQQTTTTAANRQQQQDQDQDQDGDQDETTTEDEGEALLISGSGSSERISDEDATVEIQISSSNNASSQQQEQTQQKVAAVSVPMKQQQQQQQQQSPVAKLLKMAVIERTSEEID